MYGRAGRGRSVDSASVNLDAGRGTVVALVVVEEAMLMLMLMLMLAEAMVIHAACPSRPRSCATTGLSPRNSLPAGEFARSVVNGARPWSLLACACVRACPDPALPHVFWGSLSCRCLSKTPPATTLWAATPIPCFCLSVHPSPHHIYLPRRTHHVPR